MGGRVGSQSRRSRIDPREGRNRTSAILREVWGMATAGQNSERKVDFQWSIVEASVEDATKLARALEEKGGNVQVQEPPTGVIPIAIPLVIFGAVIITALAE